MKIKLAILDKDQNYLNRVVISFNIKYADKLEIYSFTDEDFAIQTISNRRVDVFLVSDSFNIDMNKLPKRCGFAYFVESNDIETLNGQPAICKFQKADLIYKQILSIYSENANSISGLKLSNDSSKVIIFSSPGGGTGTSSAAAACAVYYASKGKTLYLNLEALGSADIFFDANGTFDMSDIVYALKSGKANLAMKLESCVRQALNGVYFYSQPKVVLDMLELTTKDIIRLITELKVAGSYSYIIIDMDFGLSKDFLKVYEQAHGIVWVGDGTELSNSKIQKAYSALTLIEQASDVTLTNRLCLMYNKFSNKSGKTIGDIGLKNIGGIPAYVHASTKQIVSQLAAMKFFDNIL